MARIAGIVQVNSTHRDYAALADDFEWMKGRLRADRSKVSSLRNPEDSRVQVHLALLEAKSATPNGGGIHRSANGMLACALDGTLYGPDHHSFSSDAEFLLDELEVNHGNFNILNRFSGKFAGVILDFTKDVLWLF
ncbi:MAG: hypothetical protein KDC44_13155, partial [Phaeodactylibacter sp.]|nr:hypothetical protein [Phaeodactylibacter sp.]